MEANCPFLSENLSFLPSEFVKLVELGFGRDAVIQALKLFDGNEEQAAGFLFGG